MVKESISAHGDESATCTVNLLWTEGGFWHYDLLVPVVSFSSPKKRRSKKTRKNRPTSPKPDTTKIQPKDDASDDDDDNSDDDSYSSADSLDMILRNSSSPTPSEVEARSLVGLEVLKDFKTGPFYQGGDSSRRIDRHSNPR